MALVETYPALSVRAYAGDYFDVLESHEIRSERKVLAMLMGSNVGNYEPDEAKRLLALLGEALKPGDGLLLGTDLKKDRATLELAYNDPAGVTAAFNRNMLARINRELDADFDVRNFAHVAHYDEARGSVDSFLRDVAKRRRRRSAPLACVRRLRPANGFTRSRPTSTPTARSSSWAGPPASAPRPSGTIVPDASACTCWCASKPFRETQQRVDGDRQRRGRETSRNDHLRLVQRQSVEDQHAQARRRPT